MNFIKKYSMMMLLLSGAITIVSCSNEDEEFKADNGNNKVTIIASNPAYESDTRTLLDENEQPLWSGEDKIKVYANAFPNEAFEFYSIGRVAAKNASFVLSNSQEEEWINTFDAPQTEFYALVHSPRATRYQKDTDEIVIRHGIAEEPSVDVMDEAQGPKHQLLTLGNITSDADLMVGEKLIKSEMDPNSASFKVRFKRLTGIMKIHLEDNTTAKELEGYKATDGWISVGTDPYGKVEPELYKTNNFGGIARIALTGDNAYQMTKERCTGLQFRPLVGKDYFYDYNGNGNEKNMYISVLPTKLNAGDKFTFILGNGQGKIIYKVITLNAPMDIKACHIHDITITINDGDVTNENPFPAN